MTGTRIGGIAAAALVLLGAWRADPLSAQTTPKTFYLVRHAETDGGDDPSLNAAGRKRSADLAAALRGAGITAILASTYRRTRETAMPLATELRITAVPVDSTGDPNAHVRAVSDALLRHQAGSVLVVGHSDTIPAIVGLLTGQKLPKLCETTHDVMVTIDLQAPPALTRYGDRSPPSGDGCL